ncbi:MAG: polysaccharide deacetylase family protein [Acidobacteria bacterium]|nr:polysaccharide deacetylase family protein [Acidobacteriota bacterium]
MVVLTFDDGTKSDVAYVAPMLKQYGFGASFYVTEGLRDIKGEDDALTWDDIHKLNSMGFEIGNHTETHPDVTTLTKQQFTEELEGIENRCKHYGIPLPTTFVYPGYSFNIQAAEVLLGKGYLFARRGVSPEYPDSGDGGRGPVYDPAKDHPLLLPTTGYSGPKWGIGDLVWAVEQAKNGKIAILNFHGVPYPRAPWVTTDPAVFARYMKYLAKKGCTVIAMRDLAKYVEPATASRIPLRRPEGTSTSGNSSHRPPHLDQRLSVPRLSDRRGLNEFPTRTILHVGL